MAKGYLVADIQITDPERFDEYRRLVPAVIAQFGGRYLVRGGAFHAVEMPDAFHRLVVLEFDSVEQAGRFYGSEEYAPLLRMRVESTKSAVAIVEGIASSD